MILSKIYLKESRFFRKIFKRRLLINLFKKRMVFIFTIEELSNKVVFKV